MRALTIFRDETDLSAAPDLWRVIEAALSMSEYFVFMASPTAASSKWVRKEVDFWLTNRSSSTILIVLTDGEIVWSDECQDFDWKKTDALPDNLRGQFKAEPLYIDVRQSRTADDLTLANPQFKERIARLAATLHDRRIGDMIGEDVRQHRRTIRIRNATITLLVCLLLTAVGLAIYSNLQRQVALRQERSATARALAIRADTAVRDKEFDLALLLSVQANRMDDTFQTRAALFRAVQACPAYLALRRDWGKLRYDEWLDSIAFSPDGKLIAATGTGSIKVWDVGSGVLVGEFSTAGEKRFERPMGGPLGVQMASTTKLAFSSDGSLLASSDLHAGHNKVWLWDVSRKQAAGETLQHEGIVRDLAFSPDGKNLAVAVDAEDGSSSHALLWDVAARKRLGAPLKQRSRYNSLTFSPDGRSLAVGGADIVDRGRRSGSIQLWDITTFKILGEPMPEETEVTGITFSRDGKHLIAGCGGYFGKEGYVRAWDVNTRKPAWPEPRGTGGWVGDVASHPDGNLVAVGGLSEAPSGYVLLVWNLFGEEPASFLLSQRGAATGIAFSPDGSLMATTDRLGNTGYVNLWDLKEHAKLWRVLPAGNNVEDVAFSPNGQLLAIGGRGVQLWDVNTLKPWGEPLDTGSSWCVRFSPDGRILASGSDDRVRFWELPGRSSLEDLGLEGQRVYNVAFSPDSALLAVGSDIGSDGRVSLWKMADRKLAWDVLPHTGWGPTVAFSPDGTTIATGDRGDRQLFVNGTLRLWDVKSRELLGKLTPVDGQAGGLVFNKDGSLLASGVGSSVQLWDVRRREPIGNPFPHETRVLRIALSPDDTLLASSGRISGEYVRLWTMSSGEPIGEPLPLSGGTSGVSFSSEGKLLAVGRHDGNVNIYDLDPQSWLGSACRLLNRNLSAKEWLLFLPGRPYQCTCENLPSGDGVDPSKKCR
jgi:WD40 repeat protein